jgi:membrane protease YdiL (CAAX protease family)
MGKIGIYSLMTGRTETIQPFNGWHRRQKRKLKTPVTFFEFGLSPLMNLRQAKTDVRGDSGGRRLAEAASAKKPFDKANTVTHLPQRYSIKDSDDGRFLSCLEAPNIAVRVEAGLTVSASAARKSPGGTIYLDGVARDEPFMDHEKQIYNFDHHEGCLRPFTLSTCEQVLVMILKGLDLRGREWKVFANEPDLDSILAIWLILNHLRIQQKDTGRMQSLYALVRLEGLIDSHGLEMIAFSGLPPEVLARTQKMIDYLRAEELDLKKEALWEQKDRLEHTVSILQKIDRIIYRTHDLADFKELKELARAELAGGRIAVVVEAEPGIYELEPYLHRIYGERLGLVILKKAEGLYTLRRMDPFMPGDLENVYRKLNYMDPGVRCRTNSHQWGGSGDIGGSPRGISTQLSPAEIAQACRDAFQIPSAAAYGVHFFSALVAVAAIIGAAAISNLWLASGSWLSGTAAGTLISKTDIAFFVALIVFTVAALMGISRARLWRFGIRIPTGKDWWIFLPVIVLAAMANGVYFPKSASGLLNFNAAAIYIFIAIPLASELLFRGLAYGILAQGTPTEGCNRRWLFSYPAVASAIIYAAFIIGLIFLPRTFKGAFQETSMTGTALAAFAFGLANGLVRERSHSILPAIVFHAAALGIFVF